MIISPRSTVYNHGKSGSVQFSCSVVSDSLRPHEPQHGRSPCPSPTPGVHPNPCPLSRWCHPIISSSVVPFSSCPQSFPASGSFQMSQLFASGGQSIGVSASKSVLPMNTQDWSPCKWQVLWFPLMCRSETKMEISWIWTTLLTANRTDYIKCAISVVNSHNCSVRWRNSWEAEW